MFSLRAVRCDGCWRKASWPWEVSSIRGSGKNALLVAVFFLAVRMGGRWFLAGVPDVVEGVAGMRGFFFFLGVWGIVILLVPLFNHFESPHMFSDVSCGVRSMFFLVLASFCVMAVLRGLCLLKGGSVSLGVGIIALG